MTRRALALRHVHFETLGTFEQPLADAGLALDYVDVGQHDLATVDPLAPDLLIVLGGPEVSHLPLRVDFSQADYLIQGEGELSFARLCRELLAGRRPGERVIPANTPELSQLHQPYQLYSDTDIAHRLIYVEASRGCPFGCEFCLSSLDKRVRSFDTDVFLAALEELWQRGRAPSSL